MSLQQNDITIGKIISIAFLVSKMKIKYSNVYLFFRKSLYFPLPVSLYRSQFFKQVFRFLSFFLLSICKMNKLSALCFIVP